MLRMDVLRQALIGHKVYQLYTHVENGNVSLAITTTDGNTVLLHASASSCMSAKVTRTVIEEGQITKPER